MSSSTDVWPNSGSTSSLTEATASNVDLNAVLADNLIRDVICYLDATTADDAKDKHYGPRISSIFVILIVSSAVTFFPVLATRTKKLRIPLYVYLFARYFGAGVIVATAFVQ